MMPAFKNIKTICICGAGTMGSGIAQVAAQAGFDAILFDVNPIMLQKSNATITASLQKLVEKNKLSREEKDQTLSRLLFTNKIEDCKADVIIEAIIENKEAKVDLINQLVLFNSDETIFATNTSSISVSEIGNATNIAARFVGMHFFNPAPLMKLVEVAKSQYTNEAVVKTIVELAEKFGKVPVVCKDATGFIVNRVARPYYLEAMLFVERKLTDIETIDSVMEATEFKMGPFKLMDLIGIDINYSVSNIVWESLGKPERLKPSSIQKEKIEQGELGKKTGIGFYKY